MRTLKVQVKSRIIKGFVTKIFANVTFVMLLSSPFSSSARTIKEYKTDNPTKNGIALVLANSNYSFGKLRGITEYGELVKHALLELGFDVIVGYDLGLDDMLDVTKKFGNQIPAYDFALVYYNGHGIQFDGEDYLLPIDTNFKETNPTIVRKKSVDFLTILELTSKRKNRSDLLIPRVIIHDACRNNPFWENIYVNSKAATIGTGLKKAKLSANTLTVFSTYENTQVSVDNPFTELLVRNLKKRGCISEIIRQTAADVYKESSSQIVTPTGAIIEGELCFVDESNASVHTSAGLNEEENLKSDLDNSYPPLGILDLSKAQLTAWLIVIALIVVGIVYRATRFKKMKKDRFDDWNSRQ